MRNKRFGYLFVFIALSIAVSCDSYLDQINKLSNIDTEIEIEPSAALPVAYGNFSLQDILETFDSTGFIEQDSDSLIYIYYRDTIQTVESSELLENFEGDRDFPETYVQADIEIPAWINLGLGESLSFYKMEELTFTDNDSLQLDSVFLSNGRLVFDVASEFQHTGNLRISSPNLYDANGDTLDLLLTISDASGGYTHIEELDLAGYSMRAIQEGGGRRYKMNYVLTLTKGPAGISLGEESRITIGFRDLGFNELYGYAEPMNIIKENFPLDLAFFASASDVSNFAAKEPNFNLYVHNSFGIPVTIDLSKFQARSSIDGGLYDLRIDNTEIPFIIDAPLSLGEEVTSELRINPGTSNIDTLLNQLPDFIDISVDASLGRNGVGSNFFISNESNIAVETELELPIWIKTDGFKIRDTLDLDLNSVLGDISLLKSAIFNVETINELPLQLELQVYFLDASGTLLDSLYKGNSPFILAPDVDITTGDIIGDLQTNVFSIEVTEDQLSEIEGTKYMEISARVETSNSGGTFVKFYSTYKLNYRLSIDAQFRINPGEVL